MADVVLNNNFNYTYNGVLLKDIFLDPTVQSPNLAKIFTTQQGVKSKLQMHFSPPLSGITEADAGCGSQMTGNGVTLTNKTLDTVDLRIEFGQCADVFKGIYLEEFMKSGNSQNDISGTAIQNKLIIPLLKDAVGRDQFDIASFGDTGSADPKINMLDGLWTRLIADEAAYCGTRASVTLGNTLADGDALKALKACYEEAAIEFKQLDQTKRVFRVTGSVFENLVSSYESNSTGSDLQVTWLKDGITVVRYRGHEVVPVYSWDNYILNNSLANPHRVLYTSVDNHVLGFDVSNDAMKMDIWYEKKDDQMYYRIKYNMGYEYKFCEYNTFAI